MLKAILKTRSVAKVSFAALLVFTFCMAHPAPKHRPRSASWRSMEPSRFCRRPGGLALEIDGKPEGQTSNDYRSFDLDPGLHTIVITLPNGQRWTREVELPAGRIKCVALNYRQPPPVTSSPCPYPVILSAPAQVNEGEIITFTSDITYSGELGVKLHMDGEPRKRKANERRRNSNDHG